MRGNEHARRAKIRRAPYEIFSRIEIFERDNYVCQLCGEAVERNVHPRHPKAPSLDHIIPIKHGGAHTRENTQCTHLMCNCIKQGRLLTELPK